MAPRGQNKGLLWNFIYILSFSIDLQLSEIVIKHSKLFQYMKKMAQFVQWQDISNFKTFCLVSYVSKDSHYGGYLLNCSNYRVWMQASVDKVYNYLL